jgi:hypothetical protein
LPRVSNFGYSIFLAFSASLDKNIFNIYGPEAFSRCAHSDNPTTSILNEKFITEPNITISFFLHQPRYYFLSKITFWSVFQPRIRQMSFMLVSLHCPPREKFFVKSSILNLSKYSIQSLEIFSI